MLLTIRIPSWDKFNPRKDRKRHSWFRVENTLFEHPVMYSLDDATILTWLKLCCERSKSSDDDVLLNLELVALVRKISVKTLEKQIGILAQCKLIEITKAENSGNHSVTDRCSYITLRYDTNVQEEGVGKKTTHEEPKASSRAVALPPLVEIWNENRGTLPKVVGLSSSRRKQSHARWEENPDRSYWVSIIEKLKSSSFCNGKNDRGWRADFDFLVRPDTQHKVLEGKYDDRTPNAKKSLLDDPEVIAFEKYLAGEGDDPWKK